MTKLKDFIVRTHLDNLDQNQELGNPEFDTQDYLFFETYDEMKNLSDVDRTMYASDYAVMNGVLLRGEYVGPKKNRQPVWHWLRSSHLVGIAGYENNVNCVSYMNFFRFSFECEDNLGLCPAMNINLLYVKELIKQHNLKVTPVKDESGKILYHTMEFGYYPQDKAKNSEELEILFRAHKLVSTGKTYTGYMNKNGSFEQNPEFEYYGKKYVRVISKKFDDDAEYKDSSKAPKTGTPMWAEVQPIKWKIKNWNDLPKELNPNGNGTAKTIYVKSEEAILSGIPFYPKSHEKEQLISMWQNSPIRAFFNGYNLYEEFNKGNGNKNFKAKQNFNFKGKGFLYEAFDNVLEVKTQQLSSQSRKSRLEKLNPDTSPAKTRRRMTDTETIKSWIDAGQSVLLRGPSGIGKTERIKKLYPDLIYIKLTNNMFPEKVVGSMNLQTGESIPPDFAKQALLACATDDEKKLIKENVQNLYDLADTIYERSKTAKGKIVIMLDELLNVKPAVQSLVYTLVLNRLVETGKGLKLPANTVIVATGNQKKYSSVAEDLAEPLEKRFDHILDMRPKVSEWIYEFAIPNKLHPSVISYILSKSQENRYSEETANIGYFYEEPEIGENSLDENGCRGKTNDPRGWESISRTLYAFEEDLKNGKFAGKNVEEFLKVTLRSKLREEWAEEFFDFYNHPTLTVDEIVEKNYSQADLPKDINEKFATMAGLLNASPEQVGTCRNFIRQYCDPEYLAVYDIYWVGNDENRMEKIAELQELEQEILEN